MISTIKNTLRTARSNNTTLTSLFYSSREHQRNTITSRLLNSTGKVYYKSLSTNKIVDGNNSNTGLYSIEGLKQPCDFLKLASNSIDSCNSIRQSLPSKPPISSKEEASIILQELDNISNIVCCIIDAAELCRNTHSNKIWRDKAEKAFGMLSQYIAELNADDTLHHALCQVTSSTYFHLLSEEEQRFGIVLQSEFERDGIHLSLEQRNVIANLQGQITDCETVFSQNIIQCKEYSKPLPKHDILNILPSHLLQQPANNNNQNSNMIQISSDAQITNTLLKHSSNPDLRKEVYMHANTACKQNLDVLDGIIHYRTKLAQTLGFNSYAHYFLKDKMVQHPDNVYTFLESLNTRVKGCVSKDMEILQTFKKHHEGGDGVIHAWDKSYYHSLYKEQKYNLDPSLLSSCFTIQRCLHGMKVLIKTLFDIEMLEVDITNDSEKWCDDVIKLKFIHEGNDLGILYLDLYPRDDKFVHAAHFTIQCGCRSIFNNNNNDNSNFQTPIVALVCNLSSSNAISHAEVETLFHEFGHALHSILSRTQFQHLSGTRTCVDFVETPSLLLENFVWSTDFLLLLTDQTLSREVVETKLIPSRNALKYLDIQQQCLYSMFDQIIFGSKERWEKYGADTSTSQLFEILHQKNSIPFAKGTHWHSRFGHLVSYGAGYYGYLYAQVFAADIWNQQFAQNPLNKNSGGKLWNNMLLHGGAKDPNVMLKDVLGREPCVDAIFKD